ncbi:MAG: pyridoxal-phosphate dependent enzyme [Chloroflexi bacterium]|nr:pyridoxal-phosphate dependent enzyme [Chloroflexota bacterium]
MGPGQRAGRELKLEFRCPQCGPAAPDQLALCPACRGLLEPAPRPIASVGEVVPGSDPGIWAWGHLLRLDPDERPLTLGEAGVPLLDLHRWGARFGFGSCQTMLEYRSPSGSFKDRGALLTAWRLRRSGFAGLVEDSSGNAGAALAAYCAAAGLECHIFAPGRADPPKLAQIQAYGARVTVVPGPREAARDRAIAAAGAPGSVYASHVRDPGFLLGMKTFAYDLVWRRGGEFPDHIVFPTGNGGLLLGTFLALVDMSGLPGAESVRLHAAQAEVCAPLAGHDAAGTAGTIASGIAVAAPERIGQIKAALAARGGDVVTVSDNEIKQARADLAVHEGVYVEPTAAAGFAAAVQMVRAGLIGPGESVVIPATGTGLKA